MSHQSSIQCKIRSIDALRNACDVMGLKLLDQKTYRGYGSQTYNCNYAIKLKGTQYDVGVVQEADGTYSLKTDFWQGSVAREIGNNCGLLLQECAAQCAMESARMQGMSVYRTYDVENEEIVIEMYEEEA